MWNYRYTFLQQMKCVSIIPHLCERRIKEKNAPALLRSTEQQLHLHIPMSVNFLKMFFKKIIDA